MLCTPENPKAEEFPYQRGEMHGQHPCPSHGPQKLLELLDVPSGALLNHWAFHLIPYWALKRGSETCQ